MSARPSWENAAVSGVLDRRAETGPIAAAPTRLPHVGGLDGLRGIAVAGVLFFHAGFGWAKGGYLGVSLFFTLSGYLITSLLLAERLTSGRIDLERFWSRRVRRLLPASLVTIAGVAVYGWLAASDLQRTGLRGDLLGSLLYVANWRFLAGGSSYAEVQSGESLVLHFWSLAIEEQFYVLWPLLAAAVLAWRGRRGLVATTAVLLAGSVASCLLMWDVLGSSVDAIYYGTHTRAAELLVGVALALALPMGGARSLQGTAAAALRVGGPVTLVVLLVLWTTTSQADPWQYRGGFALHALLAAVVIAGVVHPGPLARVLAVRPLRAVGLISYGLYLYHWPVFVVLDAERLGRGTAATFAVRMLVTVALALVSFVWIEQPVRRGTVLPGRRIWVAAPLGMAAVGALVLVATRNPPAVAYGDFEVGDATVVLVPNDAEPTTTTTLPADPGGGSPPPAPAPRAVMTIGDSGMYDATPGLRAAFFAAGTASSIEAAFPGIGLTVEGAGGWREEWARIVAAERPALSVVMLGGFDLGFLERQGPEAYGAVADELVQILTAEGGRVVWLSVLPCGRAPDAELNAVFAALAARHPDTVSYLDTGPAFAGCTLTDGAPDGSTVRIRKPDGWHLCPEGAERFARFVLDEIAALGWAPPPAPGWEEGLWRLEPRFDDPPGGCLSL
jgi:peptidoglycan/LPS O-acetylase OafA/YrhL/lysophospholipase L1-like esterase